jgi:arginine decarboxylase
VVSISLRNGKPAFTHEVKGDSVAEVLSYVEYDPKDLEARFRKFADQAVQEGRITAAQRSDIMTAFRHSLQGYTYYDR